MITSKTTAEQRKVTLRSHPMGSNVGAGEMADDSAETVKAPEDASAEVAQAESETGLWPHDGAGGDETEIRPQAWAEDDPHDDDDESSWSSALASVAPVLFLIALVTVTVAVGAWLWMSRPGDSAASVSTPGSTAAPQPFSGQYAESGTAADGRPITGVWDVTPCGARCVNIAPEGYKQFSFSAYLIKGSWVADVPADPSENHCGSVHFEVDANTLSGTMARNTAQCGIASGTATFALAKVG